MFEKEDLEKLVECEKKALEDEDRYLIDAANQRGWPIGANRMLGIRCNANERYYQFVIWRSLYASFRWRPETEREMYDLVFYDDADKPIAYAEIKCWSSVKGDVTEIGHDVKVKLGILTVPGVMLVVTRHAKASAESNYRHLVDKLNVGITRDDLVVRSFNVSPDYGKPTELEFSIIGFLAPKGVAPLRT